jgi:hypothetical protein
LENQQCVDQELLRKFESVRQWILGHGALLAKQGRVVEAWRTYHGRRLGPYFRVAYREHGRQRSIYLGKSADLADRVCALLQNCQAHVHQKRAWQQLREQVQSELVSNKATWRDELTKVGLTLKGSEVRGWRALTFASKAKLLRPVLTTK